MSKCSYQTQDEIYEVVKISKERDIKIDVIHIDGWQKEGDAALGSGTMKDFLIQKNDLQVKKGGNPPLSLDFPLY